MVSHFWVGIRLQKQLPLKVSGPWDLLQRSAPCYAAYTVSPTAPSSKASCHIQLGCSCIYPWGRAKSLWLGVGIIVPVDDTDEADEAEEESSSAPSGSSGTWSSSASSSSSKGSGGIPSFDRAQARCRWLMMGRIAGAEPPTTAVDIS